MKLPVSGCILVAVVTLCLIGPWLNPNDPIQPDWDSIATGPTLAGSHWFGTDLIGRDLFERTLQGGRISLLVGLVATLVSVLIGVVYGMISGYVGGRWDSLLMRGVDVLYALPFMFLVIVLMTFFGQHFILLFVAIGGYLWLDMARVIRAQTQVIGGLDYVSAARAAGLSNGQILRRHILPNLWDTVLVTATLLVPQVILIESFVSFLGLGIAEPLASWGSLINEGVADMEIAPWTLLFPATFLCVTLLCLNALGDRLRDQLMGENS